MTQCIFEINKHKYFASKVPDQSAHISLHVLFLNESLDSGHHKPFSDGLITGLDKQKIQRKIVNIFLPINFNICFECSKGPPH